MTVQDFLRLFRDRYLVRAEDKVRTHVHDRIAGS